MDHSLRRRLLFEMQRIRSIEEAIADRYAEQEMRCPVHLSCGQEAVPVGVCAALNPSDCVMSTHRGHAHYLAKGGDLKALMAELYGKATGCSSGKGGSMHLIDLSVGMMGCTPVVGGSLPVAVGTAFGFQAKNQDGVTVAFFGEGATEEGVFHESLNFAALWKLPIVFCCENNLYSVYSPLSVRQAPERDLPAETAARGVESDRGNGNEVEEIYRLATKAVERARTGQGPSFLLFDTYRWREHCGPNYDNQLGYRSATEFEVWRRRCPIQNYSARLLREGVISEIDLRAASVTHHDEIDEAFRFAKESPFPPCDQLMAEVYDEGVRL